MCDGVVYPLCETIDYVKYRNTIDMDRKRLSTVNSGELRIPYPVPYPVPVCVTGNLWLVKFNVFIL